MLQERLIYFPAGDPGRRPDRGRSSRSRRRTESTLTVWLRVDTAATERPAVVVFPGNAGNRAGRLPLGNALAEAGYGVVLAEYRGYGGNPGSPSQDGIISDALAIAAATRRRLPSNGGLVYFGESLGAAVAIAAAEQERPDALVLGSPFTSMTDVGRYHYPWLPVSALLRDRYHVARANRSRWARWHSRSRARRYLRRNRPDRSEPPDCSSARCRGVRSGGRRPQRRRNPLRTFDGGSGR